MTIGKPGRGYDIALGVIVLSTLIVTIAIFYAVSAGYLATPWILLALFCVFASIMAAALLMVERGRQQTIKEAAEVPGERLRRRLRAVNAAFSEAALVMDELQRDLEAQQATREALMREAERQQRLLEVNKDEAEKIRQILVGETKETIRAQRRRELAIFVAGILISAALSVPIGIWVNSIS
ncbi:hypothetical protein [Nonomuraea sp. NPDC049695]|uniref:hypothetical protein n=1 Tax=Nonomuraea sp. NPDC049695 TaxID=3154734 RepID=UPI0034195957